MASKTKKRREDHIIHMRKIFSMPKFQGKIVKVRDIAKHLNVNASSFYRTVGKLTMAQEWLQVNQKAPTEAKAHYASIVEDEIAKIENSGDIKVSHKGESVGNPVSHYVTKKQAKEKTKRLTQGIKGLPEANVKTVELVDVTVEVTEEDKVIDRLRKEFVLAPIGEMPNITEIMKEFNLLDLKGRETGELTEERVRKVAIEEDWRGQRRMYCQNSLDVLPEEVQMISSIRTIQAQEILFNHMKILNKQYVEYARTGQAKTLDGKTTLRQAPDPGLIASVAEVMRRMVAGDDKGINILINQGVMGSAQVGSGNNQASNAINMFQRKYLSQLADMNNDQILNEIQNLEQMRTLMTGRETTLTLDEINDRNEQLETQQNAVKSDAENGSKDE